MLCAKKSNNISYARLRCMQPIFFQKFHFAFIFNFPSGTDFQLIYKDGPSLALQCSTHSLIINVDTANHPGKHKHIKKVFLAFVYF